MNSDPRLAPLPDPHAPKRSWWLDQTTREAFNRANAEEDLRRRLSKEAGTVRGTVLGGSFQGRVK